jgi:peptidoglycan/LPS O-acetylase OafA/YrhL
LGTLRCLLALMVVYYHVGGRTVLGMLIPDGWLAVQMFFMISGFYMALVLNEKYASPADNWTFYSNRALRLWPPAFIVNLLVIVSFLLYGEVLLFGLTMGLGDFMVLLQSFDRLTLAYLGFINLFIIGMDSIWFIGITPEIGMGFRRREEDAFGAAALVLNHPLWTIAVEAIYYLVSPFVLRRGPWVAATLFILGGLWHVGLAVSPVYYRFWGYFFFPSAAYFFFLGALMYHVFRWYRTSALRAALERRPLILTAVLVGCSLPAHLLIWNLLPASSLFSALILAPVIPILFALTERNRADRFIGELSYGTYVVHYPILVFFIGAYSPLVTFLIVGSLSLIGAVGLYLSVEGPIDRWRQRRARRQTSGKTPGLRGRADAG